MSQLPDSPSEPAHSSKYFNVSLHPPVEKQMVTQYQKGIVKPNPKYDLFVDFSINIAPKNLSDDLYAVWLEAVHRTTCLRSQCTWALVPRTPNMNVVGSKYIYKTKFNSDGPVKRYKGRLIAQDYT